MNKKRTIFVIGYPWPYTYGGHRTTKLCRELSKEYKVICISRPLFRYLDKFKNEPFEIHQTKGIVSIYDPIRNLFKIYKRLFFLNDESSFIDSGLIDKINNKGDSFFKDIFFKLILKIKFFIDSYIAIPDDHWPWIISGYLLTKKLYQRYKPFMVISTFPISSHLIASRIKSLNPDVKWISEFPDLWSSNHIYPYGVLRQRIDTYIEKRILKNCNKIITCQPGWAKVLKNLHKRNVQYIPHCIDLKLHKKIRKNQFKSNTFKIRYMGTLYSQQIKYLEMFMRSFDLFIDFIEKDNKYNKESIAVEFIGTKSFYLDNLIKNQKYNSYFKILPKVPYEQSIEIMHNSDLLLLPLYYENNKVINWFSSKIIDYIGSQNKCLIVGDHCKDFKILTNNTYPVLNSKEKCLDTLIKVFENSKKSTENISIGKNIDILQFSISTLSSRFIDLEKFLNQ